YLYNWKSKNSLRSDSMLFQLFLWLAKNYFLTPVLLRSATQLPPPLEVTLVIRGSMLRLSRTGGLAEGRDSPGRQKVLSYIAAM
ncbi:MAG: hypothetical protein IIZ16_01685, partial [Selenomonas sp.]|nr:hypothetical protein [Selenomonas sp.]